LVDNSTKLGKSVHKTTVIKWLYVTLSSYLCRQQPTPITEHVDYVVNGLLLSALTDSAVVNIRKTWTLPCLQIIRQLALVDNGAKLCKLVHKATAIMQLTDTGRLYPTCWGHRGYLDLDRRPLLDAEDDDEREDDDESERERARRPRSPDASVLLSLVSSSPSPSSLYLETSASSSCIISQTTNHYNVSPANNGSGSYTINTSTRAVTDRIRPDLESVSGYRLRIQITSKI